MSDPTALRSEHDHPAREYKPVDSLSLLGSPSAPRTGGHRVRYIATWVLGLGLLATIGTGVAMEAISGASAASYSRTLDASSDKVAAATEAYTAADEAEKAEARALLDDATAANAAVLDDLDRPVQLGTGWLWWVGAGIAFLFMLNRSWRPATYAAVDQDR